MPQTGVGMLVGSSGMSRVSLHRSLVMLPLLCAAAGSLAGSGGMGGVGDMFSRDAEWFTRQPRLFGRSLSLETPPLTEQRPIAPDDLISADGMCSGMAAPSDANAMTESEPAAAGTTSASAGIALGRTECEVARYAGHPDNVELANDPNGDRTAVLTYVKGPRPGIYRFVGGRLASVERSPVVETPKPVKPKPKKRATT